MKNFNWKKFITATLIFIPIALVIDILYDKLFKIVDLKETFAMKNMFFIANVSLRSTILKKHLQ